jgi:hypothetical protein
VVGNLAAFLGKAITHFVTVKVKVKVKLSLYLTKYDAMKTYWESGGIAPRIPNLGQDEGEW